MELQKKSTEGDFDYSPDVTDSNVERIIQMTFKSHASKYNQEEATVPDEDKENDLEMAGESFLQYETELNSRRSICKQLEEQPNVLGIDFSYIECFGLMLIKVLLFGFVQMIS